MKSLCILGLIFSCGMYYFSYNLLSSCKINYLRSLQGDRHKINVVFDFNLFLVFSAPLTNPNDARSWQGATINTFAQLLKGADTLANRQALIDAQVLDDGYITADISQTGTLVPNSWANSYAGCSGQSSNNNYDYTCSSGKNIFELANQLDALWFQSSGTLGQTVWDLVPKLFE